MDYQLFDFLGTLSIILVALAVTKTLTTMQIRCLRFLQYQYHRGGSPDAFSYQYDAGLVVILHQRKQEEAGEGKRRWDGLMDGVCSINVQLVGHSVGMMWFLIGKL